MKNILRAIFPGAFGLLNYFTVRLLQDTGNHNQFWTRPWQNNALEMLVSVLVGYIVLSGVNRICRYMDSKKNFFLATELLLVIALSIAANNLILLPLAAFTDDGLSLNDFAEINTVPLLYTVIYYGIIRSNTYLKAYVQNQLLVEKLTNDHLDTELKFLKAQYHPHFLFNALNTVYFQMDEDVPGAKQSIELLSDLLRYQLYDQHQQVTMKQELEYLENYIKLQKIRASEKLSLTVSFDETLMDTQVYPLLFLPLVENAFKYSGGEYQLTISANKLDNNLIFRVVNSIPSSIPSTNPNSGIGLENLKRRLQLLYPNRHKLNILKKDNEFIVDLELTY